MILISVSYQIASGSNVYFVIYYLSSIETQISGSLALFKLAYFGSLVICEDNIVGAKHLLL
jgi:hypothetical protein